MKKLTPIIISIFTLISCNKIKNKASETVNSGEEIITKTANKSGEAIGETASGFVDGIGEGIDKSKEISVKLSDNLKNQGLNTGKFIIENDSLGSENNFLNLYLHFNKDFKEKITVKVLNKENVEIGRVSKDIDAKINDAGYFEFHFDKRTNIQKNSKILVE